MAKSIITSDFPTPSEVATVLKIPASRVAELNRMFDELHSVKPKRSATVKSRRINRAHARSKKK